MLVALAALAPAHSRDHGLEKVGSDHLLGALDVRVMAATSRKRDKIGRQFREDLAPAPQRLRGHLAPFEPSMTRQRVAMDPLGGDRERHPLRRGADPVEAARLRQVPQLMYQAFYGLRELPFELTSNPKYLCLTPRHREALSNLEYGIASRKGVTLLIGEAGTGKSTLVCAALNGRMRHGALCVVVNNPTLNRPEFIQLLAAGFGLSKAARGSKAALLLELEPLLRKRVVEGLVSVLIIDEAQSLPDELLEEVRLLSNLETDEVKLLPVVLAGQPELAQRLNTSGLRHFKQRVALRCDLQPLTLQETAAYIGGRIRVAGGDGAQVFSREAVAFIHEHSGGIPRNISVICDNALVSGFALGERPVSSRIVVEVCSDFDLRASQNGTETKARGPASLLAVAPVQETTGPAVPPGDGRATQDRESDGGPGADRDLFTSLGPARRRWWLGRST
jgi:general secretion pathway protein A